MTDTVMSRKTRAKSAAIDAKDFERIVADNEDRIFNTIHSLVSDYEDALDLTQETFICAYRSIGQFRQDSSISTWLYRIAINLCKKSSIKKSRRKLFLAGLLDGTETGREITNRPSDARTPEEILEAHEEESVVRREISVLPNRYRSVIVLKYLQDLSYEEIADILGCSIGTVKSRLFRAKGELRRRLKGALEVGYGKL